MPSDFLKNQTDKNLNLMPITTIKTNTYIYLKVKNPGHVTRLRFNNY